MNFDWQSVETPRLVLRVLPPAALAALAIGDRAEVSGLIFWDVGGFG